MSQWEQQKIADGEITLTIRQLLSQQTVYDHRPIDIVCSTLPLDSETQVVALSGFIGEEHKMQETVLLPGEPKAPLPVKNIEFTALGYIDGQLHLQTAVASNLANSNHGYVYFIDSAGNIINYNECYICLLYTSAVGIDTHLLRRYFDFIVIGYLRQYIHRGERGMTAPLCIIGRHPHQSVYAAFAFEISIGIEP